MNTIDLNYRLTQERLEQFRQDAQLYALLRTQTPSLRLRLAKTLHHLALRLCPEVENRNILFIKLSNKV